MPCLSNHMSLISAQNISVTHSGKTALSNVSLSVKPAEIVTILGPNGSGKSTLLRAILGILPLTSGHVSRQSGLRLGYVPQKLAMDRALPMTVRRFLSLPVRVTDAQAHAALDRVGMTEIAAAQLTALSGGQFQRVLLARALLSNPQILILDEPTQGLDQQGEAAFYRLIEDLRRDTGCAVLMVSHDLHVVMAASDRVICLNGHICCQGTPSVVSNAPEYRALFGLGTQGALALYQHMHDHSHDTAPTVGVNPSSSQDAHGRKPDDPHFGHNHA